MATGPVADRYGRRLPVAGCRLPVAGCIALFSALTLAIPLAGTTHLVHGAAVVAALGIVVPSLRGQPARLVPPLQVAVRGIGRAVRPAYPIARPPGTAG